MWLGGGAAGGRCEQNIPLACVLDSVMECLSVVELDHRVVYLAMRHFSLVITRCGGICNLICVCFE